MFLLLVIISIILIYFAISCFLLQKEINKIRIAQQELLEATDKRFKLFKDLVNRSINLINYEETFLKEIIQLRSQAQKFKQENNYRAAFFFEEKISQLALQINTLFNEFPILNKINESQKIRNDIIAMENELLQLKNKYNNFIIKYDKLRSSVFNAPITILFKKFNKKIELWKITV